MARATKGLPSRDLLLIALGRLVERYPGCGILIRRLPLRELTTYRLPCVCRSRAPVLYEGLTLPYSVGFIRCSVGFIRCVEELGYVVDLETGALEIEVAGVQWRFQPTALGEAVANGDY